MIDPTTGEIIPDPPPPPKPRITYYASDYHTNLAITRMAKTESLIHLTAIKDECKARGLMPSHERKLREAFAYNYRRLKPQFTNQPTKENHGN